MFFVLRHSLIDDRGEGKAHKADTSPSVAELKIYDMSARYLGPRQTAGGREAPAVKP
jgi:hypothetical protein